MVQQDPRDTEVIMVERDGLSRTHHDKEEHRDDVRDHKEEHRDDKRDRREDRRDDRRDRKD
jgi:hypothetical protein